MTGINYGVGQVIVAEILNLHHVIAKFVHPTLENESMIAENWRVPWALRKPNDNQIFYL